MHEKSPSKTEIGGTTAAPTVRKSTTHVGDTVRDFDTATDPRVTRPSQEGPVADDARAQLNQKDRLRESRSTNPIVMGALALAVLAVGLALYFTVLA
ncbi:hypothetical protein Poly30_00240 [Planctomycetes bacterium Poly30]|uniref:Uncharacterized protein n=1 Tax=Saltatorellus ferox TaxID=2528018 RepID=A0A518EKB7_9BACT|nr:hypothetical protein Poly30_00240 [Planctomycetes bacterium Poly30]